MSLQPNPDLPPELLALVFEQVADNPFDLSPLALVCRSWNKCATPILYRDIACEWDSRMKRLLRTLDERPALLSLAQSITINYLDLKAWIDGVEDDGKDEVEDPCVAEVLALLRRKCAELCPIMGGLDTPLETYPEEIMQAAEAAVTPAWIAFAASFGAGDWLASDRRVDGACELLNFAARCPRLVSLSVKSFDFGETIDFAALDARLPRSLDTVVRLAVSYDPGSAKSATAQAILLSRTRNVEVLESWFMAPLPQHLTLPRLRHLILREPSDDDLPAVRSFFRYSSPSLTQITLTTIQDDLDPGIASALSLVPQLERLELRPDTAADFPDTPQDELDELNPAFVPPESLYTFFTSCTTLHHLSIIYPSSHTLFDSLPPNLATLKIWWQHSSRSAETCDLGEILMLAIASKQRRHPGWIKLEVGGAKADDTDDEVVDLVREAKDSGLVVVLIE